MAAKTITRADGIKHTSVMEPRGDMQQGHIIHHIATNVENVCLFFNSPITVIGSLQFSMQMT